MQPVHKRKKRLAARMLSVFFLFFASFPQAAGDGVATAAEPAPPGARPKGGIERKRSATSPAPPSAPVPLGAQIKVVPLKGQGKAKNNTGANTGAQQRDPFSVTNKLMRQTERPTIPTSSGPAFTPLEQSGVMPKMHLRGHLKGADGRNVALLEIEGGGVHIVREKDTVGLQELGIDSAIRIKKIGRLHVIVEAGSLGRLIIVH